MKKPLELNVYPIWGDESLYADLPGHHWPTNVGYEVYRKRLTEAELAAEWHKQDNHCGQVLEGYGIAYNGEPLDTEEVEIERLHIVYRFATLPHHDEVDQ
jgi:hypothetical protein